MEQAKPVVLTKPERGREMLAKKTPDVTTANKNTKTPETYYEGYVDGKLYLVPDSNLEAMKDMINFKMRPKTSVRYRHQTSYDIQYYDQFQEKLNELLSKITELDTESDLSIKKSGDLEQNPKEEIEEENTEKDSEMNSQTSVESEDQKSDQTGNLTSKKSIGTLKSEIKQLEKDLEQSLHERYVEDGSKSSESLSTSTESIGSSVLADSNEPKQITDTTEQLEKEQEAKEEEEDKEKENEGEENTEQEQNQDKKEQENENEKEGKQIEEQKKEDQEKVEPHQKVDENRIRFLISGHFKNGEHPIYIIHRYDGKQDIFKDQKVDFVSSQENSDINVFVSGKLYFENILVESEGKPLFLNTKTHTIPINEEKSKVFQESFEHIFETEDHNVLLTGNFVRRSNKEITPCLSVRVKKKELTEANTETS